MRMKIARSKFCGLGEDSGVNAVYLRGYRGKIINSPVIRPRHNRITASVNAPSCFAACCCLGVSVRLPVSLCFRVVILFPLITVIIVRSNKQDGRHWVSCVHEKRGCPLPCAGQSAFRRPASSLLHDIIFVDDTLRHIAPYLAVPPVDALVLAEQSFV